MRSVGWNDCLKSTWTLSTNSHESDTVISTTNLASTSEIETVPTGIRFEEARSWVVYGPSGIDKLSARHGLVGDPEEETWPVPGLKDLPGLSGARYALALDWVGRTAIKQSNTTIKIDFITIGVMAEISELFGNQY